MAAGDERDRAAARNDRAAAGDDRAAAGDRRLAGAPISWGVCEVPGWGVMLPPERVLGEMASLGLRATELGPLGYLPLDPGAIRAQLDRHGLRLVGGFVPLVLHDGSPADAQEDADRIAAMLAGAGAELFVAALVADDAWSKPVPLDDTAWRRMVDRLAMVEELVARRGLTLVLHPHVGTQVETAADVERLLATSDVRWCLDSGHLLIGGSDPADFVRAHADRIAHVHLKDVHEPTAARLRAGELSLMQATQAGLFRPLGQGDAGIDEVVGLLDRSGYAGWLVLEQDTAITGQEPPVGRGPLVDVRTSIDYLQSHGGMTTETAVSPAPASAGARRRRIGVGLVGFGWLGQAHSRSLLRIPTLFPEREFDVELVICADTAPARRHDAVEGFGFAEAVDDWRRVVEHSGVDVMFIAAPNMLHLELVEAAVQAGKHVFCEKPVGGTPAQTARAMATA